MGTLGDADSIGTQEMRNPIIENELQGRAADLCGQGRAHKERSDPAVKLLAKRSSG